MNSFCTPLEYLSGYIQNRLEDCKRIEIIENRTISIKQQIHQVCNRHYPIINNSAILNKLCLNNWNNLYASFKYVISNEFIVVDIYNKQHDFKQFIFTIDYRLVYVFWNTHLHASNAKVFNTERFTVYNQIFS